MVKVPTLTTLGSLRRALSLAAGQVDRETHLDTLIDVSTDLRNQNGLVG